eukprot:TRINITY_DN21013_c0_g1_i1.p1 TRINITY_DN21013_c0_g1~~TRINITY_DN21013_c0_g1_i1.p1  ORF type:complete len:847 (-),score=134.93 TRINITY_DN21013_c0_g1_i1:231-2648(-)
MVTLRASSEDLGFDFALALQMALPERRGEQRCDCSALVAELSRGISQGAALDMRDKIAARRFDQQVEESVQNWADQRAFYAELSGCYERMARLLKEMRRDYWREIDHLRNNLREALGGKRVETLDPDKVVFFDPAAYDVPGWQAILNLVHERDAGASGTSRGYRRRSFADAPSVEEAGIQTDLEPCAGLYGEREDCGFRREHLINRWAQTDVAPMAAAAVQTEEVAQAPASPSSPKTKEGRSSDPSRTAKTSWSPPGNVRSRLLAWRRQVAHTEMKRAEAGEYDEVVGGETSTAQQRTNGHELPVERQHPLQAAPQRCNEGDELREQDGRAQHLLDERVGQDDERGDQTALACPESAEQVQDAQVQCWIPPEPVQLDTEISASSSEQNDLSCSKDEGCSDPLDTSQDESDDIDCVEGQALEKLIEQACMSQQRRLEGRARPCKAAQSTSNETSQDVAAGEQDARCDHEDLSSAAHDDISQVTHGTSCTLPARSRHSSASTSSTARVEDIWDSIGEHYLSQEHMDSQICLKSSPPRYLSKNIVGGVRRKSEPSTDNPKFSLMNSDALSKCGIGWMRHPTSLKRHSFSVDVPASRGSASSLRAPDALKGLVLTGRSMSPCSTRVSLSLSHDGSMSARTFPVRSDSSGSKNLSASCRDQSPGRFKRGSLMDGEASYSVPDRASGACVPAAASLVASGRALPTPPASARGERPSPERPRSQLHGSPAVEEPRRPQRPQGQSLSPGEGSPEPVAGCPGPSVVCEAPKVPECLPKITEREHRRGARGAATAASAQRMQAPVYPSLLVTPRP